MKKLLLSTMMLFALATISTAQTSDYFEGFEGWDFTTPDWLPEGWTEQHSSEKMATLSEGAFTWHVGKEKNNLPLPPEGKCYAVIFYAYEYNENGKPVDIPQDEWMFSPTYSVSNGTKLSFTVGYSPLYLFDLNNENINWGKMEFKNRKPSTVLKVYLRSDGGEWTLIKDLYEEWSETSLEVMFNNYFDVAFFDYEFDLSEYAGTDVQVAFQFVGMYGNTMEIDKFQVTAATLGVDDVAANDRVRPVATVENGDILVEPCGAEFVDVYSANAGLVCRMNLNGTTVIGNSELSSGVYLLKFNEGTVLKVVK